MRDFASPRLRPLKRRVSVERAAPSAELDRDQDPHDDPRPARENRDEEVQDMVRLRALRDNVALAVRAKLLRLFVGHGPSVSGVVSSAPSRRGSCAGEQSRVMNFTRRAE